jgi:hypothetical protein
MAHSCTYYMLQKKYEFQSHQVTDETIAGGLPHNVEKANK